MSIGLELVSVIVPTRNRSLRLQLAIASVQMQSWNALEIIIVDDASTDKTSEIAHRMACEDSRIRYLRNEVSRGGGGARNIGIETARGAYIAFLDDDDTWLPDKLTRQVSTLQQNPDAAAISCSFYIERQGRQRRIKHVLPSVDPLQLIRTNHLGGMSMCVTRRAMLDKIGAFDPAFRSCQDWDLWIRLRDQGPILVCNEPLVIYASHEGARITSNAQAVYSGRRRLYFRYADRMDTEIKLHHLRELVYCRKILRQTTFLGAISGVSEILSLNGCRGGLRYSFRYLKQLATK